MNIMHSQDSLDIGAFPKIDINLYPLFIAIFEHQNISQSAQLLFISQSAASHALQRLRSQLNDDLFVRSGTKMLPTPFSEQIYPTIKNALISIQNISQHQQQFSPSMVKTLKIAVHDEIEPLILPKLVKHFHDLNLEIQFTSIKLDRKSMVSNLATQQIDFVIDIEQNISDKIQFDRLLQDQFLVCTQQNEMNLERYLQAEHIGVSSRRTGILVEDVYLNKNQHSRNIILRCQHYSTALQILAERHSLVLTIPASVLKNLDIDESLSVFKFPFSMPDMNMGIYWNQDLELNLRHQFLKNEIIKIFCLGYL